MRDIAALGMRVARHLRGDIYELRVDGDHQTYRLLFAAEGRYRQVLLALGGFPKKTRKTPPRFLQLAEKRLGEWRRRGGRKPDGMPTAKEPVASIRYIIYDISKEGDSVMTDDLERHIRERERRSPGFATLVDAAVQRRAFARRMAARRKKIGLSQTQVAARMETSASIVGRVESGADVRLSTLEKYVSALGFELELKAKRSARARPTARRKSKAG